MCDKISCDPDRYQYETILLTQHAVGASNDVWDFNKVSYHSFDHESLELSIQNCETKFVNTQINPIKRDSVIRFLRPLNFHNKSVGLL